MKSYIGDKQIVRKILNGNTVYGSPDFAQYYNIQGYDNYEVVGSSTIVDGVASGFSKNNYLKTDSGFSITENTKLDIGFKLTGVTAGETSEDIMYSTTSGGGSLRFYLATNGKVRGLWSGADGTTKYINVALTYNNNVNFRFLRDGSDITFLVQDNNEWITLFTSDAGMRNMNITQIRIGGGNSTSYFIPLDGSIVLNQTYIKVNGKYWFNGNPNYKELLDCNPNVYLQNSENCYINTGISCDSTTDMSACFTYLNNTVYDLAGASSFYFTKGSSSYKLNFGNSSSYTQLGNSTVFYPNLKSTAYYKGNEIGLNGLTTTITRGNDTNPIYLFRKYSRTGKNWRGKVYWFEISRNNSVVRHLVPVPKGLMIGSFTVPENGMFDITTQTFFANAGTGTFIWGFDGL